MTTENKGTNKRERAIELMELISITRKQLREWEEELDGLLPKDAKPEAKRRAKAAPRAPQSSQPPTTGNGRGELTAKLRLGLKSMPTEFTSRELMTAAGIPKEQEGSAFAAISRLTLHGEMRKSTTAPGKYQNLTPHHSSIRAMVSTTPSASATLPVRILALFTSEPRNTFDAPSIGKRIGITDSSGVNSIRGALSRLSRDGKIEKVSRGGYRAVSGFKVDATFLKGDAQSR